MHDVARPPRRRWSARLVAVRSPEDPEPLIAAGRVVGEIAGAPRGRSNGFGFDPVMCIPAFGQTFAQLPVEVKNAHSHRGRAAQAMVALVRERWLAPAHAEHGGTALQDTAALPAARHLAAVRAAAARRCTCTCHGACSKCPYCDFNSHEAHAELPAEQRYLDALLADLEAALPLVCGPHRCTACSSAAARPACSRRRPSSACWATCVPACAWQPQCEITLEANPGTFEKDRFRDFRRPVSRACRSGCRASTMATCAHWAVCTTAPRRWLRWRRRRRCFDTFNLDMMYALPGQTLAQLGRDIQTALAVRAAAPLGVPPHASSPTPTSPSSRRRCPKTTPPTPCWTTSPRPPAAAGLQRYEVSAYARAGHRCCHNLNYWQFGDYLGIGAGAHSKLSFAHRVVRQVRLRDPQRYMAQALGRHSLGAGHRGAARRAAL